MRSVHALVATSLALACTPADPLSRLDAGSPMPVSDGAFVDSSRDAEATDATAPADALARPDARTEGDLGPEPSDAEGPSEPCGDTACSEHQVCGQICGEPICAGTVYGVSCLDNCGCVTGFECNELSQRCTPCVSDGQCEDGAQCLRGPGVCAPRVAVADLSTLISVVIDCGANVADEAPRGCAELDTSMGLTQEGMMIDALEPFARDAGCAGLPSLTPEQNQALSALLGCEAGPAMFEWRVALPTGLTNAGCVYTLPSGLTGGDAPLVVVDECETPPRFTD